MTHPILRFSYALLLGLVGFVGISACDSTDADDPMLGDEGSEVDNATNDGAQLAADHELLEQLQGQGFTLQSVVFGGNERRATVPLAPPYLAFSATAELSGHTGINSLSSAPGQAPLTISIEQQKLVLNAPFALTSLSVNDECDWAVIQETLFLQTLVVQPTVLLSDTQLELESGFVRLIFSRATS